jgi:hypothetical protein
VPNLWTIRGAEGTGVQSPDLYTEIGRMNSCWRGPENFLKLKMYLFTFLCFMGFRSLSETPCPKI